MQAVRPALMMPATSSPTEEQRRWLRLGVKQPGGKLPLYDENGNRVSSDIILACAKAGWVEPWTPNPISAELRACRLTEAGRLVLMRDGVIRVDFSLWRRDTGDDTAIAACPYNEAANRL